MKKILIIVIVVLSVALAASGVTIYLTMKKVNEPTEEEKLQALQEEINKIDYESLATYSMESMTIPLKRTGSKSNYIVLDMSINVKDDAMKTRVEALNIHIVDAINGIFESKTKEEIEGKREEMKEPILQAVRNLFAAEEDKMQIISVSITKYIVD